MLKSLLARLKGVPPAVPTSVPRSDGGGGPAAPAPAAPSAVPSAEDLVVEEALQALQAHRFDEADRLLQGLPAVRGQRAAQAFYQLAGERFARDQKDAACALLLRTLSADETHAEAHANLGLVLHDLQRDDEAAPHFARALELDPSLVAAAYHLGIIRIGESRWHEAVAAFEQAVARDPRDANLAYWLGTAARGLGDPARSQAAYREALRRDPGHVQARWALAVGVFPSVAADESQRQQALRDFADELTGLEDRLAAESAERQAQANAQQPFYIAYIEENHRQLLSRYGGLCARLLEPWATTALAAPAAPAGSRGPAAGKCRVGIVSAHIRWHSVWNAIVRGWIESLDPERFEVQIFHTGAHTDAETRWAAQRVHRLWGERLDWAGWARVIAGERLDVLVYPEIGMDTTVMQLAALRLAPRQLASWGHPLTTGLPTIDRYLSADAFEPPDADDHYSEQLVRLPRFGCSYRALEVTPEPVDFARLGIEPGDRVLVSPGMPFKYAPGHDPVLVDVARRCAPCKLLIFSDPADEMGVRLQARLRAAFADAGVDFDRHVRFLPWLTRQSFFGLLERADVFLDTIGFSGFNTAMQAVQCGTPIVAWEGRFMRGRFASAILRQLGLDEWIASDPAGFAERAQRLCDQPGLRDGIRARMAQRQASLFDDRVSADAFAAELLR